MHETKGLVLHSFSLGESDKIVAFLTPDFGVVRGVAKGARRLKSRFAGSLELFSEVNLTFFKKERELVSFGQIELCKSYFRVISQPDVFPSFSYLARILLEFVPAGEKDERFYRMVKACLDAFEVYPKVDEMLAYFEFWTLKLSGYMPSSKFCGICGRRTDTIGFDRQAMCFICDSCASNKTLRLNKTEQEALRDIQRFSPAEFLELSLDENGGIKNLREIFGYMITAVAEKEIKVEEF